MMYDFLQPWQLHDNRFVARLNTILANAGAPERTQEQWIIDVQADDTYYAVALYEGDAGEMPEGIGKLVVKRPNGIPTGFISNVMFHNNRVWNNPDLDLVLVQSLVHTARHAGARRVFLAPPPGERLWTAEGFRRVGESLMKSL